MGRSPVGLSNVSIPRIDELQASLGRIIKRVRKLLARTGYLIEERGMRCLAEADSDSALMRLQAEARTYRVALGRRAEEKVSQQPVPSRQAHATQSGCVNTQGFERTRGGTLWRPSAMIEIN